MRRRKFWPKVDQALSLLVASAAARLRPGWGTNLSLSYYKRHGMNIVGTPNYVSTRSWFDGTDYSLITIGHGTTISSEVSFLTHDWSLHTIGRALEYETDEVLGSIREITVGDYCFVGRGAILMPGCSLGRGCVVGAGAVVRGDIPEYSLLVGNPAEVVGRTDDYFMNKVALREIDGTRR